MSSSACAGGCGRAVTFCDSAIQTVHRLVASARSHPGTAIRWRSSPFPWECLPARIRCCFASSREPLAWRSTVNAVLFRDIAAEWRSSEPRSASAAHALALALALLGDQRAVDTLEVAKSLAIDVMERQRLVMSEVWLRIQFAAPSDIASLRRVRLLTDSLLRSLPSHPVDPSIAASVAALCGHAFEAVRLDALDPPPATLTVASPLGALSRSLTLFAAFGGPTDSLRALERGSDSTIKTLIPPASRQAVREEMLGRALGVEFPVVRSSALASGEFSGTSHCSRRRRRSCAAIPPPCFEDLHGVRGSASGIRAARSRN